MQICTQQWSIHKTYNYANTNKTFSPSKFMSIFASSADLSDWIQVTSSLSWLQSRAWPQLSGLYLRQKSYNLFVQSPMERMWSQRWSEQKQEPNNSDMSVESDVSRWLNKSDTDLTVTSRYQYFTAPFSIS